MKRTSIFYRVISFVMIISILCAVAVPASAIEISPDFAPTNTVLYSVTGMNASSDIIDVLHRYDIDFNPHSVITAESVSPEDNSSILHVTTSEGNTVEEVVLMSLTKDENNVHQQDNFAEELFITPNASSNIDHTWDGVRVKFVSVYDRDTNGNYVRPTGQYFTCYDQGGSRPSKVVIETNLGGTLYTKSGSTYTYNQSEYVYNNYYSVTSPAFNTTYSKNKTLATGKYIVPQNGFMGLVLDLEVVIDGETHWWAYQPSLTWY